jgi:hypothetical protein
MKPVLSGGTTILLKKYRKYYIMILILLMITPSYSLGTSTKADDISLILKKIDYPTPIIEGEQHILSVTIKNTGDQAIPGGKYITDQLYINSVTILVDENQTNEGLPAGTSFYLNLTWTPTLSAQTLIVKLLYDGTEIDESWIPITVTERETDLILHTLTINGTPILHNPINIHANTTNIGKNTTQSFSAALFIDQERIQNIWIKGLNKNQSHNFTYTWTPSTFGYHIIKVIIDPHNIIAEANESNNYQQKTLFVQPYQMEWYSPAWHYRKFLTINGSGTIAIPINFTALLNILDVTQQTFENTTITPIIYEQDGSIDTLVQQFTFKESTSYHPQTNAVGTLLLKITQDITYLTIYFDVIENDYNRTPANENTSLTPSGNISVADEEQDPEGWWANLLIPSNNYYPLNTPSDITATTQAYAHEVRAFLYYDGNPQEILDLNSTDFLEWQEQYSFTKEGNWTIHLEATDAAGYQAPPVQSGNLSIQAIPDIYISKIIFPIDNITEGNSVTIHTILNNSGDSDAENYEVRLYITQGIMKWDDTHIRDKQIISIKKDESKQFDLTWETAYYGLDEYDGKWLVGIWVFTNTSYPDLNTLNNKATKYPLVITKGEEIPPTIQFQNIPSQIEKGLSITISAIIRDTSGIKKVNISIITPQNTKFEKTITEQSKDTYTITYTSTNIIGKYTYTITAIDNSYYKKKTQKTGTFTVIDDATPPTIEYIGIFPRIQLLNMDIIISCITHDLGNVSTVEMILYHPDGYQQNVDLIQVGTSEKYRVTKQFSLSGKYLFNINVVDESTNSRKSNEYEFWITSDLNDTDDDGMPDYWETRYGLNPIDAGDANQDSDDDGLTNLQEYEQQTNPTLEISFAMQFSLDMKNNAGYFAAVIIFTVIIILLGLLTFRRR